MITRPLIYKRPASCKEAVEAYFEATVQGHTPVYYNGGSEVNTFTRKFKMKPDVLIDLKGTEETMRLTCKDTTVYIGASVSLNEVIKAAIHPLITSSLASIADHTTRNHITFGGNICGRLPYREAVLPLLLTKDVMAHIQTQEGLVKKTFTSVFKNRLILNKGEVFVGIEFDKANLPMQADAIRKTKSGKIDYPLIHVMMSKEENHLSIATSGYGSFPDCFENISMSDVESTSLIDLLLDQLTDKVKSDGLGSADYRKNLMKIALGDILKKWEVLG